MVVRRSFSMMGGYGVQISFVKGVMSTSLTGVTQKVSSAPFILLNPQ